MANQEITARLRVKVEGLKESVLEGKALNQELDKSERLLSARGSGGANKTRAAAMAASATTAENVQYGQMRGTAGATGAAGRDFAEQSRGLGGLVRLYATFAANIFAVSAAFNVLRNAMDTTNLINGLNSLGASSGKSLGSLSKSLVAASDGAISLREAMSSVAMTSSAGMTNQNILRLGAVAKNASIGLGISMPDALNRLSRGIVKLEPELLDELGIFTKIEPATQAYALQLGKATSQLTDFERRQAFANAVLKEGEDKFAALANAEANPYDKLLASLKDVAYSGLELLNRVLKPIVEILASSPTALALGLTAIIAAIVKRAIPAVADLRAAFGKNLERQAEETTQKLDYLKKGYDALTQYSIKSATDAADARVAAVDKAEKKILDFYKNSAANTPQGALLTPQPAFKQILQDNPLELTQKSLADLKVAHADYVRQVTSGNKQLTEDQKTRIALEKEFINTLETQLAGEVSFSAVRQKALADAEKALQSNRLAQSYEKDLQAIKKQGAKDSIIQNANMRAGVLGIGIAFQLLKLDIENANISMSRLEKNILLARGASAILTGKLLSGLNAVNGALTGIAIAAAVFSLLEGLFSKNEKQVQKFNSSLDAVNDSIDNTKRTLAELDRAGLTKGLTDQAIAISNAFNEISESAKKLVADSKLAKEASTGWFDTIVEGFKDFFGFGIDAKVAKGLSKQLISALDILRRSDIDEKYRERFKELLQVQDLSAGTVEDALNRLGEGVRERFTALLESARKEVDRLRSDLESFRDASDKALKSYQEFLQSTASTDPLFKLGDSMQILADSMITAMSRGTKGIMAAFEELSKDPKKAALFGPEFVKQFVEIEQGFKEQANAIRTYEGELKKYNGLLDESKLKENKLAEERKKKQKGYGGRAEDVIARDQALQRQNTQQLNAQVEAYKDAINFLPTDKIDQGRELFLKGLDIAFDKGAKYIAQATGNAMQQAGLNIAKAQSLVLSGALAVEESTRIKVREIDIQINAIKTNIDLIKTNEILAAETSALRASIEYTRISQDQNATAEEKRFAYEQKLATDLVAKVLSGTIKAADISRRVQQEASNVQEMDTPGDLRPSGVDFQRVGKQARAAVQAVDTKLAAQNATLIIKQSEKQAALIEGNIQKERAALADKNKLLNLENDYNQVLISRRNIIQSIAGITTKEQIQLEGQLEIEYLRKKQAIDRTTIELAYLQAAYMYSETGNQKYADERDKQQDLLKATDKKHEADVKNLQIAIKKRQLDQEILDINKKYELKSSELGKNNAILEAGLQITRAQFTSKAELYDLDKQYVANSMARFDLERANFDARKQTDEALLANAKAKEEAEIRLQYLRESQGEKAYIDAVNAEQQRQNKLLQDKLLIIETERKQKEEILEIQRQQTVEQEKQNYLLSQSQTFADILVGSFGTAGEKLGAISKTLIQYSVDQEKGMQALGTYSDKRLAAEKKIAAIEEAGDIAGPELIKEKNDALAATEKQLRKNKDVELKGIADTIGGVKNLFKQHTGAYKAMAAMEKAFHVMRMINMAMQLAGTIRNAATEIATKAGVAQTSIMLQMNETLGKMPFMIGEIYGKTIGQLGIFGPPVAAALVALAFGSLGGRGKSNAPFVPNAEQQQKVQGTAMGYDSSGKEIQVRRGVFGDTEAKSESISKSIERIKETSIDGLTFDNKILKTLQSIDSGINKTAKGLYGIAGLRTGSLFGTKEGAKTSGITGLFGKTTSTNITDSGVILSGSFDDLASAVNKGSVKFYETVQTVVKKSGFLGIGSSTKTYITTEAKEATDELFGFFTDIFANAKSLLVGIGKKTGTRTEEEISSILKTFDLKDLAISLRGLKGEDLAKEVESVISSVLDDATLMVFQSFEKYANFGEGLLETVIRVVDSAEKIDQQIRNIGIKNLDLTRNYDVTEALAQAAGGFDEFIDKTEYFRENFLTEAERLAPIQEGLRKDLDKLGFTTVDTKEEFKTLVQSIELVDKATGKANLTNIELFNTLQDLAPAAEKVFGAVDNLIKDLISKTTELEDTGTDLERAIKGITNTTIENIDILKQNGQATKENIEIILKWTKAAQLKELRASLKTMYEDRKREMESSISALEKIKTSLVDFRTQLTGGELSPESTLTKFGQLQNQYDSLLKDIQSSDSTVAQKAAEKFPELSTQLLNTAKTLYGSGEIYQTLHSRIIKDLDSTTEIVNTQITDAQAQLTELLKHGTLLGFIDTSTKTTANKIIELVEAYHLYNAVAKINTGNIAETTASSLAAGNTITSSVSNAYTKELANQIPNIPVIPLELSPEAKAAIKRAEANAEAARFAAETARLAAEAAQRATTEMGTRLQIAIDNQTEQLATVLVNTSDKVADTIDTSSWSTSGSFGTVEDRR